MKPYLLHDTVIWPALSMLATLTGKQAMSAHPAHVMLLAIALQESNAEHRWQIKGPARGYWQFEKMGGLAGVLRHRRTGEIAENLLAELNLPPGIESAWGALPYSELLQAGIARLLLWSDPRPLPLPMPEAEQQAWDIYLDNWRPGKPHRNRWENAWKIALDVCGEG